MIFMFLFFTVLSVWSLKKRVISLILFSNILNKFFPCPFVFLSTKPTLAISRRSPQSSVDLRRPAGPHRHGPSRVPVVALVFLVCLDGAARARWWRQRVVRRARLNGGLLARAALPGLFCVGFASRCKGRWAESRGDPAWVIAAAVGVCVAVVLERA